MPDYFRHDIYHYWSNIYADTDAAISIHAKAYRRSGELRRY